MSYSVWAKKRKALYALGLFLIVLSLILPFVFIATKEHPTCYDGKQNQGETAPDMGGPCPRLDPRQLKPLRVLWSRILKIRPGYYNMVTYVENRNEGAIAFDVPYKVRLVDADGITITEKNGVTDIYPGTIFPIFMGGIDTGYLDARRMFFDFLEKPVWYRTDGNPMEGLKISKQKISFTRHSTRLSAEALNDSLQDKENIFFIATLFDKDGSAIAASQTYLPYLIAGKRAELTFTWPGKPKKEAASVDIVPIIDIDKPEGL